MGRHEMRETRSRTYLCFFFFFLLTQFGSYIGEAIRAADDFLQQLLQFRLALLIRARRPGRAKETISATSTPSAT